MTDPARGHLDLNLPLLVQESVSREFDGKCRRLPVSTRARFDGRLPAVCFAKSTFFPRGLGFPDGGRQFVLQKAPFFSQEPACPMGCRRFVLQKVPFFAGARLDRLAAGGLFCISSLLLEVLWLIRMQSYICTMIIAVRRRRLKVDIVGESVLERLGETARQI